MLKYASYLTLLIVMTIPIFRVNADESVLLAEGKVSVFKFQYDFKRNLRTALFRKHLSKNVLEVEILDQAVRAYISDYNLKQFEKKLSPGIFLLLVSVHRPEYNTDWEVIDVEEILLAGESFENGEKSVLNNSIKHDLLSDAKQLTEVWLDYKTKTINRWIENINIFRSGNDSKADTPYTTSLHSSGFGSWNTGISSNPPEIAEILNPSPPESGVVNAKVIAIPSYGTAPLDVTFDASASNTTGGLIIENYSWDFDASNGIQHDAFGKTVSHTYVQDGTFTVTLTITDNLGKLTSATILIKVGDNITSTDIYVDPINGDDSNSGSSINPLKTITHAMTHTDGTDPVVIYLSGGTYKSSNGETFPVSVKDKVTLQGAGFNTIIDGGGTGASFIAHNLNSFTLNSLTIQNTQTGIDLLSSTATVQECQFINFVDGAGDEAAISVNDANLTVQNTLFQGTIKGIIQNAGASTSSLNIDKCEFTNTSGHSIKLEDANSSITITNSSFHDGWGLQFETPWPNFMTINIKKCKFYGPIGASVPTSEVFFISQADSVIENCLLYNISGFHHLLWINSGTGRTSRIYNCTFQGNIGNATSSTLYYSFERNAYLRNCVFSNNSDIAVFFRGPNGNGPMDNYLDNNLFFNNTTAHVWFEDLTTPANTNYSIVDLNLLNGVASPENNFEANPQYKNSGTNDYRPDFSAVSPLIDAGLDDANTPSDDYNAAPRPIDGDAIPGAITDIGAFEYQGGGTDPVISGRIYDSQTGETIDDAVIGLYRKNEKEPFLVQKTGKYSFNVFPGVYCLIVKKSGYHFPSKVALFEKSQGKYFTVEDGKDVSVDIPLDSGMWLELDRTANKKEVETGEIVTINSKIYNPYFFDKISNVDLIENLPPGFKYIENSCRLSGKEILNPVKSGQSLFFNVGSISSKQTINISYQMVASSGAAYASVQSIGVCAKDNQNISEQKSISLDLIPDVLFYSGTVMGKVSLASEITKFKLEDIELITEYGLKIKPDKYGKFHIPDIKPGRHLLKIHPMSIPKEYETEKPILFEVVEGGVTHVDIEIKNRTQEKIEEESLTAKSTNKSVKENSLFIVALGEIEIGHNKVSGNKNIPKQSDNFKEGTSVFGRGAMYIEGKKNGFSITGSLDTDRLKDKNKFLRKQKLFTRLPAENYSIEYGDDSELDFSNTETLDALHLKVVKNSSYAKWGSLGINYPYYRRIFHGGELNYRTKSIFNDINGTEINAYWAGTDHKVAFEEFNGTGGSVYYLKNDNVIEGSEKLLVQLRESLTQRIIREIPLNYGEYQIFYDLGRLILNKPISTYVSEYSNDIIQNNVQSGNMGILCVYYEYKTYLPLDQEACGGRVIKNITNNIQISGQHVKEENQDNLYQLNFGEIKYLFNPKSWIRLQYGESKGGFSYNQSYDGGITFSNTNLKPNDSGKIVVIEAESKAFEPLKLEALYSMQSPGFSALSSSRSNGLEKYFAGIEYHLTKHTNLHLSHFIQKTDSDSPFAIIKDKETLKITKAAYDLKLASIDLKAEYQLQEIAERLYSGWINGQYYSGAKEMAGLRADWRLSDCANVYTGLQQTIKGFNNDQYFAGGHFSLCETSSLSIEGRKGNIGEAARLGLSHITEDGIVNSFSLTNNSSLNNTSTFIDISKIRETSTGNKYQFSNKLSFNNGIRAFSQGVSKENKIKNLIWGAGYEGSSLDYDSAKSAINRESAHLWYRSPFENFENSGKIEWREDIQNNRIITRSWYLEQEFKVRHENGLSISGSAGLGYAENPLTDKKRFDFTDIILGFAYRPAYDSRFNLLGKYIYLSDMFPDERDVTFIEDSKTKKHVYSTGFVWNVLPRIYLSETIAYRKILDKTGNRSWQESETFLWINGISYAFYQNWKIKIEYRILDNKTFSDSKQGYLTELLIPINDYFYMGLGYNFTSFDDDLSNKDDYDIGGAFIRLATLY